MTPRDITRSFSGKRKTTTQEVREWMGELVAMGMATTTDGKKYTLSDLSTPTLSTKLSTADTTSVSVVDNPHIDYRHLSTLEAKTVDNVDNYRQFIDSQNPYGVKVVEFVDNVDKFSAPFENFPKPSPAEPQTVELSNRRSAGDTVQNHPPLSEPEIVGTGDIKLGSRVEIVGSDIKHYNGVTGTVVDVWVTAKGEGYMVKFDKPISNADSCDFPACEVRKLRDSDG
ncbi:MAG: hypothetical protein HC849_11430 [Oscillatoriales cyanobacterium RU_3_3]|nr:hypothetical protein [Oscillatoriales cyanobacterium RU_3_3]